MRTFLRGAAAAFVLVAFGVLVRHGACQAPERSGEALGAQAREGLAGGVAVPLPRRAPHDAQEPGVAGESRAGSGGPLVGGPAIPGPGWASQARPEEAGIPLGAPPPGPPEALVPPPPEATSPQQRAHRASIEALASLAEELAPCGTGTTWKPRQGAADAQDSELLVEFETGWYELRIVGAPLRFGSAPNETAACVRARLLGRRFQAPDLRPGLRFHVPFHPPR